MSGDPIPRNFNEAAPALLWGVFAFATGFEGIVMLFEGHFLLAALGIVGAVGLTAVAVRWSQIATAWPEFGKSFNSIASDARWWVATLMMLLLATAFSPYAEQRRWPFLNQIGTAALTPKQATPSTPIELTKPLGGQKIVTAAQLLEKVDSLQSQLDATNLELKAARQPLGSLSSLGNTLPASPASPLCLTGNCPAPSPLGGNIFAIPSADKVAELEGAVRKLEAENQRLEKERQAARQPPPPAESAPLTWESDLFFVTMGAVDGGSEIPYFIMRGSNLSGAPVQLRDAYIMSDITGERRAMVVDAGTDGKIPISQANPVPSGASITLVAEFNPHLPMKEIAERWMKLHFKAEYEGTIYSKNIDLEKRLRDFPELKLGPRVTKKKQ